MRVTPAKKVRERVLHLPHAIRFCDEDIEPKIRHSLETVSQLPNLTRNGISAKVPQMTPPHFNTRRRTKDMTTTKNTSHAKDNGDFPPKIEILIEMRTIRDLVEHIKSNITTHNANDHARELLREATTKIEATTENIANKLRSK